ncbi:hypothetical protein GE21DRAFT_1282957 [Neurospora crassa]|nr:hypothetical protein GE21DRAFT_1282957 [Neurospora crassa]
MAEVGTSVGPPRVAGTETRPEKRSKTEMNAGQMRTASSAQKTTSTSTSASTQGARGVQTTGGLPRSVLKKGTGSSA